MNDTVCQVAWKELYINHTGKFRNCCIQQESYEESDFLSSVDPNQWFKEQKNLKDLRIRLIQNEKPFTCLKCWKLEEEGLSSYRLNWNEQYKKENNQDLNERIEIIDLRLGNRCNLKCRMCNTMWSDQIGNLYQEAKMSGIVNSLNRTFTLGTTKNDENFLNDLFYFCKNTKTIKEIKFAGGEPFIMEDVEEFIFRLVENGMTDIKLSLLTNTTVVKSSVVKALEKFKSTHIQCSIDGVGKEIEYQRYPCKWEVIERNFIKLYNSTLTVNLTPCWSHLNLSSLPDFLNWASQFPKSHIAYNEVNFPTYFDFRLIPLDFRQPIIKKIKESSKPLKLHKDYEIFFKNIEYQYRLINVDEVSQLKDAIEIWNFSNPVRYQDRYPWADLLLNI